MNNLEIGKRISKRRKELNLSRAELGMRVSLHETTIKKYEDGDIKNPSIEIMEQFAEKLKTSPLYLVGWEKYANFFRTKPDFDESTLYNINSKTFEYFEDFITTYFSDLSEHIPNAIFYGENLSNYYEGSSLNSYLSVIISQTYFFGYSLIYKEIFNDLKQSIINSNNMNYNEDFNAFKLGQFNGLSNQEIVDEVTTSIETKLKDIMYETLQSIFTENIVQYDNIDLTWDYYIETFLKSKNLNIFKDIITPYVPGLLQVVKKELIERLNFETIKDVYYNLNEEGQNINLKYSLDLLKNDEYLK